MEGEEAPGTDRYQFIHDELYKSGGKVKDEKEAMQILAGVGRRTWGEGKGCTVHSVIYNLTKKTIMWVANENYNDPSATFEFKLSDL